MCVYIYICWSRKEENIHNICQLFKNQIGRSLLLVAATYNTMIMIMIMIMEESTKITYFMPKSWRIITVGAPSFFYFRIA